MNTYVGIDIAKAELVVHALPLEQQRSFANNAVGLNRPGFCRHLQARFSRLPFELYRRDTSV